MPNPIHARTQQSGARKYVDPADSTKTYPSVTTIIGALDKPALPRWAANSVAEYAVDNRETWSNLDRAAAYDLLKNSPWRARDKAAKLGSEVHEAAEAWMLDKPMPAWNDGVEPFMEHFVEWLQDFEPAFELVEATVCNPALGYAGTLDAIVFLPRFRRMLLVDYKTGKGVYPETALQLAAYQHATEIWLPDGSKVPMIPTEGAAVLHLRPGGYSFVPINTGGDVFAVFLAALTACTWKSGPAGTVLGEPLTRPVSA